MQSAVNTCSVEFEKNVSRHAAIANHATVLSDIYQESINLAVWKCSLSTDIQANIKQVMNSNDRLRIIMTTEPENIVEKLMESASVLADKKLLCTHIALIVDMFCCLFELKRVGLRLITVDKAMCPKFHVDKVPCRLITTLSGTTTEWLHHADVDRSKLGAGSQGMPDKVSGIFSHEQMIQRLDIGDVALLKGEGWFNNEQGGLVHRSPSIEDNNRRLMLTLDFMD
jgi:hypothetical protein